MDRITLEPGKRGGRPCIRGLRISVYDVLSMLSSGMTQQAVLEDFPELTQEDILAVLAYAVRTPNLNRASVLEMLLDHKDQIHHALEIEGMSSIELIAQPQSD